MKREYDVIVIGAGPTGSSAARTCALSGLKTLLIEKNASVGINIQCAETISQYLIPKLPLKIPETQLRWKLDGMYFWAEGVEVINTNEEWQGYNISRNTFDKWLSEEAVKSGAELLTDTKLVDIEYDSNYFVKSVTLRNGSKFYDVKTKYVIAADGVYSTVARRIGVLSSKKNSIGKVIAYDIAGTKINRPRFDHIFFGDFAPSAYAYIMPKDSGVAGVGVGTSIDKNKSKLENYFDEFISIKTVKNQLGDYKIIDEKSGDAPVASNIEKLIYGNIIFCGDAAGQNIKPFLEGILPGIICGDLSAKYLAQKDRSNSSLNHGELSSIIDEKLPLISQSSVLTGIIQQELDKKNASSTHLANLGIFSGRLLPEEYELSKRMDREKLVKLLVSKK